MQSCAKISTGGTCWRKSFSNDPGHHFQSNIHNSMNTEDFRQFARTTVDFIADYLDHIRDRPVLPSVEPGYLQKLMPESAPEAGESWQKVLQDVDSLIMPGLTHWHSPHFHAYYPTANSYPGIVGELFLSGLGTVSTDTFPDVACVELELKMMDWLAKIIGLPDFFLNSHEGAGGGVIQNAASESTFIALMSGKSMKSDGKLVAYTSEQSNSSVEKAGLLASVPVRLLQTDEDGSLRGKTLEEAVKKDLEAGLMPCCVIATLGTTGTCAFDKLDEIGEICKKYQMWLHVDAAYAGSAFACPEYRYLMKGIEHVDSFSVNPHKWMLVNADCSAMWIRDTQKMSNLFGDSRQLHDWQLPNERRFRALKLWFVLRMYGVDGVRKHIKHQINLAAYLEQLVRKDDRFEVIVSRMGLVCFRMKGKDLVTERILDGLNAEKQIFVMPYYCQNKLVIRFVVCSRFTQKVDIDYAWNKILEQADKVVKEDA